MATSTVAAAAQRNRLNGDDPAPPRSVERDANRTAHRLAGNRSTHVTGVAHRAPVNAQDDVADRQHPAGVGSGIDRLDFDPRPRQRHRQPRGALRDDRRLGGAVRPGKN